MPVSSLASIGQYALKGQREREDVQRKLALTLGWHDASLHGVFYTGDGDGGGLPGSVV